MMSEMQAHVVVRFSAEASEREISLTEWLLYKALAASMMVGVGEYRLMAHE